MNRDEILAKSRQENTRKADEREVQISANASKIGLEVGGAMMIVIFLIQTFLDESLNLVPSCALYFSICGSSLLYEFIKTKGKGKLVLAIISLVCGVANVVEMIASGLQK